MSDSDSGSDIDSDNDALDAADVGVPPTIPPAAPQPRASGAAPAAEDARALPDNICLACDAAAAQPAMCVGCRCVVYCSDKCAEADAPNHRPVCALMARLAAGKPLSDAEQRALQIAPNQLSKPAFVDAAHDDAGAGMIGNPFRIARGWSHGPRGYWRRPYFGARPEWCYNRWGRLVPCDLPGGGFGYAPGLSIGLGAGPLRAGIVL